MARKLRVDLAGFYHIINRGVARMHVFLSSLDKEKFLQIIGKASKVDISHITFSMNIIS